jgi:hypothetical protein
MQPCPRDENERETSKMEKLSASTIGGIRCGPRKNLRLVRGDELCGVIVYVTAASMLWPRLELPIMPIQEQNQKLSIINRIVIPENTEPSFRGLLISETFH